MLRQVYLFSNDEILYERNYGKGLSKLTITTLFPDIKKDAFSRFGNEIGFYDYYKYKISYLADKDLNLIFIFTTGLSDDFDMIKTELYKLRKDFLSFFGDMINNGIDQSVIDVINPTIDIIHKNLRPKIALVGFSGVGKTTITKLIRAEEIPFEHIPTITGEVATIKIGKLHFSLWDFAGQEQFSFLWNKFIKGSDAVLLITDSTIENVEKSRFFLELINEEAPHAYSAVIGNKQDMAGALPVTSIESILGIKTYSMIAIDPKNREKMIQIIADILDMSVEISPLLKPLFERDKLINKAQLTLERGDFKQTAIYFEKIADICIELGDDSLGKEFFEKSEILNKILIKSQNI